MVSLQLDPSQSGMRYSISSDASDFGGRESLGWESDASHRESREEEDSGEVCTEAAHARHDEFERHRQEHYRMKEALSKGKELAKQSLSEDEEDQ